MQLQRMKHKQTDRRTNRHADRLTDRQTERQTDTDIYKAQTDTQAEIGNNSLRNSKTRPSTGI